MESDSQVSKRDHLAEWRLQNKGQIGKKLGSRANAINQHCKDCIYDEHNGLGTWRQQVEACTVTKCALYEFRPTSRPHKKREEDIE